MRLKGIFQRLFIFEMANNHMGSVEHGLRIIRETHEVCKGFDFKFGFKLQYRDLDTFIHPDFKDRNDIKYVKRFMETRLTEDEMRALKDEIQRLGFVSICTPFDENSVAMIERHGFDVIKIASCSLTDWPLLERIAKTEKPIIASTAGASLDSIDKAVTFFEHRTKDFCVMHCVGEYPTGIDNLQLNQIDLLRKRYPEVPIGYSTHESPDEFDAVKIAVAKGAAAFERHVGISTDKFALNAYSSNPGQVGEWLAAAKKAYRMCGVGDGRHKVSEKEISDLRGLQRGVFAKRKIARGERINTSDTFFAIPNTDNQVLANDMSKYMEYIAASDIEENKPVMINDVNARNLRERVLQIINSISRIVADSRISLPEKVDFELSHHYGIERFEEWGAAIINCINREYCKKLIILVPGQKHPIHHHVKKEETFNVLYGDVALNLNGVEKEYNAGDMVVVERGVRHSFGSKGGAIFEEISTTHFVGDSYYEDEEILKNTNRKTEMTFWTDWLKKPIV